MKDPLMIEVQGYFEGELSQLGKELVAKEEKHRKTIEDLRNLPFVSRLERFLKPFLKWLLPRKVKKLRTEIANLREKIKQYEKAETELKEGKYGLTLIFLDELADRFLYTAGLSSNLDGAGGTDVNLGPDSMFFHITDLRKELASRMKEEMVESISK